MSYEPTPDELRQVLARCSSEAIKHAANPSTREELRSAGLYGVAMAMQRYKAGKGASFPTYCRFYIFKYQMECLRALMSPVSFGYSKTRSFETAPLDALENTAAPSETFSLERIEEIKEIDRILETFTPEAAQLLRLRYFEGKTIREIAKTLKLNPDTVMNRLAAAAKTFRARYQAANGGNSLFNSRN